MDANFQQLQSFVAVVEHGGFAAAARRLGMTASALSKHINALESHLGVRLFARTTRRVSVTDLGRAYYERVAPLLSELEDAGAALGNAAATASGRLRVSAPMDFGRGRLATAIGEFARAWPEVAFDIELTDRYVDLVGEGFDVGLRIGPLADSNLVARPIATFKRVLVAAPTYLAEHGHPHSVAELKGHQLINFSLEREPQWSFLGSGRNRASRLHERHRANNGQLLCALAEAAQGLAFLPDFIVDEALAGRRLLRVLAVEAEAELILHAVYPHRRLLSASVRLFIDHLADRFSSSTN